MDAGGELGGLIEPQVDGQPDRVGHLVAAASAKGEGSLGLGDGATGHVGGDVPVQRAVVGLHHRLDLAEERPEVGHSRTPGRARLAEQRAEVAQAARRRRTARRVCL